MTFNNLVQTKKKEIYRKLAVKFRIVMEEQERLLISLNLELLVNI